MPDSPEFAIQGAEYLGKSFSGDTFSVRLEKADEFYQAHKDDMVPSGLKSFLSSMRIPGGFFKERNPVLQQDLVVDTKATVKEKKKAEELFILVIDGVIQFVAPRLPSGLGWEDPTVAIGLDPEVWSPIEFDVNSGLVQYIHFPDKRNLVEDQYFAVAFMVLPIFYAKPIKIDLGIYKLRCQNGAVDSINTRGATFRPDSLNPTIFAAFADGVCDATKELAETYQSFFDFLGSTELGVESARSYVRGLMESPSTDIPSRVTKKVMQHVELLASGKEVPSNSPDTMSNYYDIFDAYTFYSHQGTTKLSSRINTDRKTFDHFFKLFNGKEEEKEKEAIVRLPDFLNISE